MEIHIEPPHRMEVESLEVDPHTSVMRFKPRTARQRGGVSVSYLTAIGDAGTQSQAAITFNTTTGRFQLHHLDAPAPAVANPFDLTPTEFNVKRDKKKHAKRKKKREDAETDANEESTPVPELPSPPPAFPGAEVRK